MINRLYLAAERMGHESSSELHNMINNRIKLTTFSII
jgi:hypothetical protein